MRDAGHNAWAPRPISLHWMRCRHLRASTACSRWCRATAPIRREPAASDLPLGSISSRGPELRPPIAAQDCRRLQRRQWIARALRSWGRRRSKSSQGAALCCRPLARAPWVEERSRSKSFQAGGSGSQPGRRWMNSRSPGSLPERQPPPSRRHRRAASADAAACSAPRGKTAPADGIHETVRPILVRSRCQYRQFRGQCHRLTQRGCCPQET